MDGLAPPACQRGSAREDPPRLTTRARLGHVVPGLDKYRLFINGEWIDPSTQEWFDSFNPYTGTPWARVPRGGALDVERAVAAAKAAFESGVWPTLTATERGALLRRLGDLITRDAEKLAQVEVRDNGKLITEMRAQMHALPQWYHYFGGLADKVSGSVVPIDRLGTLAYTRYEPLGVVVAMTPWNSPLMLASWKIGAALAAGNTIIVKPSEHASISTLEFARIVDEAGFPPGVFNVLTGFGQEAGQLLASHADVAKVAFTGGEGAGRAVYGAAARNLKGVLLELGGKSPNIIFQDADLDAAVNGTIAGIFAASGQTCLAGSRLLLHESIYDNFVARLITRVRDARIGDPSRMDTHIGPIATLAQYHKILEYIDIAREQGATCVLGGEPASGPNCGTGWFIQPTIFTNVKNAMRIAQEEVFGPVLSVISFRDEDEAVSIANDTPYGLAAGIWTRDISRALRVESRLRAGTIWINTYRAVSVMLPFGGFKRSGIGRENGEEAVKEYLAQKAVWINCSERVASPFAPQ
jgi:acyl-CoA reductase-like NAD-dependent aldehyde dehydrogenase